MRSPTLHKELGLTDDELSMIVEVLGRAPSDVELAMYAVMWSEHCSYKSSRVHLSRLPTEGSRVLVGPGENAGVVDVGDGVAVALRIESHNHPSAIEPYQGAATGVGGILRDIFTMGARPIALLDPLFIGPLEHARSRYILDGVVRGIAGYGNAVGVPTVGGQLTLSPAYKDNPLVNVFCLGILRADRLVLSAASGPGNLAVLLGSRTGRDGIGGVSVLASAGFGAGSGGGADDPGGPRPEAAKRPSVQVGDPFEEKRLIEACLMLMDRGLVVAVQDLGGAGLSCAASEAAARAGLGMDLDVAAVPRREPGMSSVEVMTSESQERMLAVVEPSCLAALEEVCARFEVEATVVGTVRVRDADGVGRLRVREGPDGPLVAELPAASLSDGAPRYRRPIASPGDPPRGADPDLIARGRSGSSDEDVLALLLDPVWVYRQYDHQLFCNTVLGPGEGDAAVLRLAAPGIPWTGKGLALSSDANPGWCRLEPRRGTAATVAESVLNVACTGARAIALVNCLNFGNPEHPEVMWQLSEAIDGMADACLALGVPVVGGNVSLYNEHSGSDIEPTPVVAVLGLIDDLRARPPAIGLSAGDELVLLGRTEARLGGSRWAELHGAAGGELFALDLAAHRALVDLVCGLVVEETLRRASSGPGGLVSGLHDVSAGGLAVALAELASSGRCGVVAGGVV
ncbi:MAG TPA: phosphoribosylformylglycinamidine synthase subunit PurL, partial [Acidimicrobiales bacterium]|nr:phosphoribosylformylglycinamidine synthase subunit PurL [Acidimicrobiales bacterium]